MRRQAAHRVLPGPMIDLRTCRVAAALVALYIAPAMAQPIPIHVDVPDAAADYTGRQPVTFGVPFPRGALQRDTAITIESNDAVIPGQFEVAATWGPDSDDVKWLLVDTFADMRDGVAQPMTLHVATQSPGSPEPGTLTVERSANAITINTGPRTWRFDAAGGNLGRFILATQDGDLDTTNVKLTVEKTGPVRAVVKITGDYTRGDQLIGEFITRVRLYAGSPIARVFHTFIWQVDHKTHRLGGLRFERDITAAAVAGLDGQPVNLGALRQTDHHVVTGSADGQKLDGYLHAGDETIILRWPWQQHPTGFRVENGKAIVGLIDPAEPLSLDELSVAVHPGQRSRWSIWVPGVGQDGPGRNGLPVGILSPRGFAKTYEFVIWPSDEVSPARKNDLVQHPVYAYADPAAMTRIDQPLPMTPRDDEAFAHVESAISRAFDWIALEHAGHDDFGYLNFGDVQWNWSGYGFNSYRYWMNHGKGWSVVPWVLFMRSGERKYRYHGEVNGRHCMDVDICHVRHWDRAGDDAKMRGSPYHYSGIHWAHGPHPSTFFIDSEYLPYHYYLTGDERARDVMLERVGSFKHWNYPDWDSDWWKEAKVCSRYQYSTLRDLAVLYEATWDSALRKPLEVYYDYVLSAQHDSGYFPGITSPFYLDQALLIADRALDDDRGVAALKRWIDFLGDYHRDGYLGRRDGHLSHWGLVEAYRHSGDARLLDHARQTMNATSQAVAVGDTIYNGMATMGAHTIGPELRGWVALMAEMKNRNLASDPANLYPMSHFHGRLPVAAAQRDAGWEGRHVVLALDEDDEPLTVRFWCALEEAGDNPPVVVRRIDPDGAPAAPVVAHVLSTYKYTVGTDNFTVEVPADGKRGVYAFEVWTTSQRFNVMARSSAGRVVHYMPPGKRILNPNWWAGRFWFEPEGDGDVFVGYPAKKNHEVGWGRSIAYAPDGSTIVASRIDTYRRDGDRPGIDQPLRFTPSREGLHSALIAGGHLSRRWERILEGMRPYFASTKDQFFDPEKHPCPDLSQFLTENAAALDNVKLD